MALTPGTRLGIYEITAPLGAGGMGEVYRARDTKLDRDVALKILPESFASDPDRVMRFEREAKTLATLNHPHIAQIYGIEGSALVMELVDGEDLAERIARGPMPIDEMLPVARQIAEALEAAHEQGIIHRDLKPANIKIRSDGTVKVLDFGLAKALDATGATGATGAGATVTSPAMTMQGVILGTAAYMSPEQAKGKPADKRSDIWAFGCVLYEMLTATRAFGSDDVSETLAEVLKVEPQFNRLPVDTPAAVRRLLPRCLQKNPRLRLQHMGDARLELDESVPHLHQATPRRRGVERMAWGAALILAAGAAAAAGVAWRSRQQPPLRELRLDIATAATDDLLSIALSPDGRALAYVAGDGGARQLLVRMLDGSSTRMLPGTTGAQYPFWSPDSRSIGFFTGTKLRRIDVDGGPARDLANVLTPSGGSWNAAGTILFVPNSAGSVFTISAEGGPATPNATIEPHLRGQRRPQFLPDGRHFLIHAGGGPSSGLFLGELGKGNMRRLTNADSSAVYAAGHLLFVRERALIAQPFDLNSLDVTGPAIRVADDVVVGSAGFVALSASNEGIIVYRTGGTQGRRQLLWFDRSGKPLGEVGSDRRAPSNPVLSSDGRFLAVQDATPAGGGGADIWIIDLERNVDRRLTSDPAIEASPTWSPDGTRIVFNTNRRGPGGHSDLFVKDVGGSGSEQELLQVDESLFPSDWSRDGRFLLYRSVEPTKGTYDLMALALEDRKPFAVSRTAFDERDGQFAPDGRSIAFHSDESGRPEIYVQSFPEAADKVRISTSGGTQPRWRSDGKELFYIAADNRMMAVAVSRDAAGRASFATPQALFATRAVGVAGVLRQQYVVTTDGQRFLINSVDDRSSSLPVTVLLNWRPTIAGPSS